MAEVWTPPALDDITTTELVTAAYLNQLGNSLRYLKQVARQTFTASVNVTATTVGTANQIVSLGAVTYENVLHKVEFYAPRYTPPAQLTYFIFRDGTTVIETIGHISASASAWPLPLETFVTPSAASHTYNIAAWLGGAATGVVEAGTGGAAGNNTTYAAGFMRIVRIPV